MSPPAEIERLLDWLHQAELAHSRLLWRLRQDARLDPPWPYAGLWHDPAGAVLIDLSHHPEFAAADPPWLQAEFTDPAALELLCGVRLPARCELLVDRAALPLLGSLGSVTTVAELDVLACPPGRMGEAAIAYQPVRLTARDRALCAAADWRPDDLADETDLDRGGVRYALLRDGQIASRLLVQKVCEQIAELADVATDPAYRRRGYAAALIQQVVRRLHERGWTVTYSTHPTNQASQALARGLGFSPMMRWGRYRVER